MVLIYFSVLIEKQDYSYQLKWNMKHTNLKLYGWSLHENGILTRIPASKTIDKLLYVKFGEKLQYLGIPEEFKDYTEAQYLIQKPKLQVYVLKKKLSELFYPDFWTRTNEFGNQCEVDLNLWEVSEFDKNAFKELYEDWSKLRPVTQQKHTQLKLF